MKKLLFLLLTFPLFIASCSDDKEYPAVPPTPLTNTLTGEVISHNQVSLEWEKVTGAHSYQVYFKEGSSSEWSKSDLIMPTTGEATTMSWGGDYKLLKSETEYVFQIRTYSNSDKTTLAESNKLELKTKSEL